jgi:aryl-alcohol dehydrogenase-like predicted oxidoreductase
MNRRGHLADIPMSSLGFGCYGFCGAYGSKLEESQMINILHEAYELGVLFYDTANKYGNTEEILGNAVKGYRNKISIASKVGLTDDNSFNLTKKHVIESCELSLKKLKMDYLDIYQVHYDDPSTPVMETVEALEQLKKQGKIRHYGIGHIPFNKSLEYFNLGHVSTVLAEISAVATSRYKDNYLIQSNYDFDIIAFSVTGRGLLTGQINYNTKFCSDDIRNIDPLFKRERFVSGLRIMNKLKEIGNRYNKTTVQVAISWVIQKPGIAVALTGPSQLNHLKENSEALHWKLDNDSVIEIDMFIEQEEENLKEVTSKEIYNILNTPLELDFDKASNDLIYVMEHCIENEFLLNEDIIPKFLEILKMKREHNESLGHLEVMRNELNTLMQIRNILY